MASDDSMALHAALQARAIFDGIDDVFSHSICEAAIGPITDLLSHQYECEINCQLSQTKIVERIAQSRSMAYGGAE